MRIILSALLLAIAGTSYAQVSYREAEKPVVVLKNYDSSISMITRKDTFNSKSLIGQEIIFLKRESSAKDSLVSDILSGGEYSGDYFTTDKATLISDLASKEQLAKAKDEEKFYYSHISANDPSTNENDDVTTPNISTKIYKPVLLWGFSYGRICVNELGTPYSAVENKTFKIVDWVEFAGRPQGNFLAMAHADRHYIITLEGSDGERLVWHSNSPNRSLVYFKGFLDKVAAKYLNQTVYFSTDSWAPQQYNNPLDGNTYEFTPGKKWTCTEVTFYGNEKLRRDLVLILKDSLNKEVAAYWGHDNYSKFLYTSALMSQKRYDEYIAAKKAEKQAEIAKAKADKKYSQESLAAYRKQTIENYGKTYGPAILEGRVEIGMTMDMCTAAWGSPITSSQSKVDGKVVSLWAYSHASYLKFVGNKLVKIVQ